ncbi:MAG: hypothetical protein ACRD1G_10950, partial [Acidimicrobiales bacterium]
LCDADVITKRYLEDEICWIADCEICEVPMVVWARHGPIPPAEDLAHMLEELEAVGTERFGRGGFHIDKVMRQIPDHFHAHARDPNWWARRFNRR